MSDNGDRTTTGQEWVQRFLQEQASVAFNLLWVTFSIGQAGTALEFADRDVARQMAARLSDDVDDLESSMSELIGVSRDLVANALRNANAETN